MPAAIAQITQDEELALAYGDRSTVSIATGARQPIARAPSVATVITAEDIEAIGARNLEDVLEMVPGLHVSRIDISYMPAYIIRGIHSGLNPQVLLLINGVPTTSAYTGNRGTGWGGMGVDNIARIEIMRGPGSAVYGAEALAGVINIITKEFGDVARTQVGATAGSFDTWDVWTQDRGQWGSFDTAFYLRAGATHGQREIISADAQTQLDSLFGTSASHAPGPLDVGYRGLDFGFNLSSGNWRWHNNAFVKRDIGSGAGIASALDPTGRNELDMFQSALTYERIGFAPNWDVRADVSFYYWSERSSVVLFPPGAFGGAFPEGMIGEPEKWERHYRIGASAFYSGFSEHQLRIGAGWANDDLYRVEERKNFRIVGLAPMPTGPVAEASESDIFLTPHDRQIRYLYVQDEWTFANDWYLTAGVRNDHYSDFGGTTNPRVALVWEATYNLTAKLLYGRAFRAPSFVELYARNNPVAIGNPDLRPETIQTTEAALIWRARPDLELGATVFHYHMRDAIRLVVNPDPTTGFTWQNSGEQTGNGAEFEVAWDATKSLRLSGNYALQHSVDEATGQDAGSGPRDHVYARADWRLARNWILNGQFNWIANRRRAAGDARPDVPDYQTVDASLHLQPHSPWQLTFTVRNLFDADAREPTSAAVGGGPASIPNDIPLPGRSYLFQFRYEL